LLGNQQWPFLAFRFGRNALGTLRFMLDMLLLITTEEPEVSRAISSEIEFESRVAVRSPQGAELRVSLGAES